MFSPPNETATTTSPPPEKLQDIMRDLEEQIGTYLGQTLPKYRDEMEALEGMLKDATHEKSDIRGKLNELKSLKDGTIMHYETEIENLKSRIVTLEAEKSHIPELIADNQRLAEQVQLSEAKFQRLSIEWESEKQRVEEFERDKDWAKIESQQRSRENEALRHQLSEMADTIEKTRKIAREFVELAKTVTLYSRATVSTAVDAQTGSPILSDLSTAFRIFESLFNEQKSLFEENSELKKQMMSLTSHNETLQQQAQQTSPILNAEAIRQLTESVREAADKEIELIKSNYDSLGASYNSLVEQCRILEQAKVHFEREAAASLQSYKETATKYEELSRDYVKVQNQLSQVTHSQSQFVETQAQKQEATDMELSAIKQNYANLQTEFMKMNTLLISIKENKRIADAELAEAKKNAQVAIQENTLLHQNNVHLETNLAKSLTELGDLAQAHSHLLEQFRSFQDALKSKDKQIQLLQGREVRRQEMQKADAERSQKLVEQMAQGVQGPFTLPDLSKLDERDLILELKTRLEYIQRLNGGPQEQLPR
jgi:chromosome segregation ATPase